LAFLSGRFVNAYKRGLDGKQAVWVIKKYCGHCVLPEFIMQEFEQSPELQFIILQLSLHTNSLITPSLVSYHP
ncbi:uncharacterized protein EDB91DRAFT_1043531, partial [Suillus paluster]|uniref:uncharacterized protein n=1 Tax=Suillus paluster TaxID=48578 RepID=UPI001B873C3C